MDPCMRKRDSVTIRINKFALMLLLFVPAIVGIVALMVISAAGTIGSSATALAAAALMVILMLSVSIVLR